jgi:hypothetical protein
MLCLCNLYWRNILEVGNNHQIWTYNASLLVCPWCIWLNPSCLTALKPPFSSLYNENDNRTCLNCCLWRLNEILEKSCSYHLHIVNNKSFHYFPNILSLKCHYAGKEFIDEELKIRKVMSFSQISKLLSSKDSTWLCSTWIKTLFSGGYSVLPGKFLTRCLKQSMWDIMKEWMAFRHDWVKGDIVLPICHSARGKTITGK